MEKQKEKNGAEGEFRFGKAILMAGNLFRRMGDENLSKHEINTGQLQILSYLSRNGKEREIYQKDLEEAFGVRRSSVTSILQNMEKNGLLIRESAPTDARAKKITLTEKGTELDHSLRSFICGLEEEMMEGITAEEKTLLRSALMRIIDNLEKKERNKV